MLSIFDDLSKVNVSSKSVRPNRSVGSIEECEADSAISACCALLLPCTIFAFPVTHGLHFAERGSSYSNERKDIPIDFACDFFLQIVVSPFMYCCFQGNECSHLPQNVFHISHLSSLDSMTN